MLSKQPIIHELIRQIPKQFSWIDHRLITQRYIDDLSHQAATLYLFLVTVGDYRGLSYYSDKTITKRLSMSPLELKTARDNLIETGLIAYQTPLYQVLSIENKERMKPLIKINENKRYHDNKSKINDQPIYLGEIITKIMKGNV